MSNKGPKDKYTSLMVADRLRVLSDEMDIMDDGYSDVLQAAMSFDDNQLLEALNKLKQSPTSKISTLATELLAHWQPENAVTVEDEAEDILNMDPLPLTRRPDDPAHDDLMQRMNAVTAESVEDEDILDMIEPVFAELTQQKNEIAAKKAAEPQIKSALKGNKTSSLGRNLVIGNMLVDPEKNIIVDPANEKTMNGNGGVSGAIKAMFAEKGLLRSYVTDLLKFPKVAGKRCPNGEVKHTVTGGIDVIHTSAPDLREKQNRQPGSKREPSDEAKEKLFQAYYNAFRMAHNLNSNDKAPKPISVPLLGAGIFKWPAELSAEIAGKAMTAFRDKYGNGLKINLYARPEDLKNGLTEQKLQIALDKGERVRFANDTAGEHKDLTRAVRDEQTHTPPIVLDVEAIKENPEMTTIYLAIPNYDRYSPTQNDKEEIVNNLFKGTVALTKEMKSSSDPRAVAYYTDIEDAIIDAEDRIEGTASKSEQKKFRAKDIILVEAQVPKAVLQDNINLNIDITAQIANNPELLKINKVQTLEAHLQSKNKPLPEQPVPTTPTPSSTTTTAKTEPVKIDGVKQAKLNFINGFMDKFNALPESGNSKIIKEQMIRDLNNYAQSTDNDIQSHARQVLSQLNQQKATIQASKPQAVLNRDLKLDKELKNDYLTIYDLSDKLFENMISSKAFDQQSDSVRGSLIEIATFLRGLNDKVLNYLKGDAKLGELIDFVQANGIPNAQSTNPLQILKDGIDQLASALKVTDPSVIMDLNDLQRQIADLSNKQNIPLNHSSIDLQKALTKTPELSIKETSKSTQSLKINIKDMYDNERSLSIDRNTTLSAFARNAVKRITHSKDPERDSQIAGIQALVDNVNNANDPEKKDAATRELVFALQYVKYEIARTKKTSLVSALDTVCDKVMATIPNKDSYSTYIDGTRPYNQGEINLIGKTALDNVKPKEVQLESKSKEKPGAN